AIYPVLRDICNIKRNSTIRIINSSNIRFFSVYICRRTIRETKIFKFTIC
ncbi:hypothetical protein NT04LM_4288a, partial [Listeria monocytogenes FSL F2-208]